MFGALKRGRFRSLASLILVVNVVGELQQKRTLAASRGFLAAAGLSCYVSQLIRLKTTRHAFETTAYVDTDTSFHFPVETILCSQD